MGIPLNSRTYRQRLAIAELSVPIVLCESKVGGILGPKVVGESCLSMWPTLVQEMASKATNARHAHKR